MSYWIGNPLITWKVFNENIAIFDGVKKLMLDKNRSKAWYLSNGPFSSFRPSVLNQVARSCHRSLILFYMITYEASSRKNSFEDLHNSIGIAAIC